MKALQLFVAVTLLVGLTFMLTHHSQAQSDLADVAVESLLISNMFPKVGEPITFTVQIKNVGNQEVTGRRAYLYINPADQPPTVNTPVTEELIVAGITWPPGDTMMAEYGNYTFNTPGEHVIYAWVDPLDRIVESDEQNNLKIIKVQVSATDTITDKVAPHVDHLVLAEDSQTTAVPTITLNLQASDPNSSSGIISATFVQLEYNTTSQLWVPTAATGWLGYSPEVTWQLSHDQPGLKYIQASAIDGAQNLSAFPYQQFINLISPTEVYSLAQDAAHSYRYTLCANSSLMVHLEAITGDTDVYIWPPDWEQGRQPFKSNLSQGNDELVITAPIAGNYQIEVYSYAANAQYKIAIQTTATNVTGGLDPAKPLRLAPLVSPNEVPPNQFPHAWPSGSLTVTYQTMPVTVTERIEKVVLNNGVAQTNNQTVTLAMAASAGTTEVFIQQYEYYPSAEQWLLTKNSGWLLYTATMPFNAMWDLQSTPGVKYFQIWAKDKQGQLSSQPYHTFVTYAPSYTAPLVFSGRVGREQKVRYKHKLNMGDPLVASLKSLAGDADLYIWSPDSNASTRWGGRPAWVSELSGNKVTDQLALIAPVSGEYIIEVYGYSTADYQLSLDTFTTAPPSAAPSMCQPIEAILEPSPVPPAPSNPSTGGDLFESDNTCAEAKPISTDGTMQIHTFHDQADEDWTTFQTVKGLTYLIDTWVPPTSSAHLIFELWRGCSQLLDQQLPTYSRDGKLEFFATANESIAIRVRADSPNHYGPDLNYYTTVRVNEPVGAAIIVAGRSQLNDPLQANTEAVTEQFYTLLRDSGYSPERIFYLSANINSPHVTETVSLSNLESAINQAKSLVSLTQTLTIFIMAPGEHDQLSLNSRGEMLKPSMLDGWLTALEIATKAKVNVIIEANQAGSFIDATGDASQTIRRAGRLVIASTSAYSPAYTSTEGAVFADAFLTALSKDRNFWVAFEEGRWATQVFTTAQTPWLNADDNSTPNQESDYLNAAQRSLHYPGATFCRRAGEIQPLCASDLLPYIKEATISPITNGSAQLQVTVLDDTGVSQVWADLYLPSGEKLTLSLVDTSNGKWVTQYDNFTPSGTYRLVIYALDESGTQGRPYELRLTVGGARPSAVYLPLIVK